MFSMKRCQVVAIVFCALLCLVIPIYAAEQTLALALQHDPISIDPRFITDADSARVIQLVANGLVQKDPSLNIIPCLAERWENPDNRTYVFYLRRGVKFHDGAELTADDVKYTFESVLNPDLQVPGAEEYRRIERIDTLDDYTIRFTLKEPFAPFLEMALLQIVPKKATEAHEGKRFTETVIGTGPFRLVEWKHDESLVFEAFPEHFQGAPKLQKIVYRIIPDDTTAFLELKQGGLNFLQDRVPEDLLSIAKTTPGLTVLTKESVLIYFLGLNLHDPILSNLKVRQAMAYAIDRQLMLDHLIKGQGSLATGLLSPSNWAYEPNVKTYAYNPEQAKSLLDEAGFPDPDGDGPQPRFHLTYKTSAHPFSVKIAEVAQDHLKQVGIAVDIQSFEFAQFINEVESGRFQMYRLSWIGISEPDMFYSVNHSDMAPPKGRNREGYSNPRIDALTELGRVTLDRQERKQIYSDIQKILAEELPYIYLWYPYNIIVMSDKIRGFTPYPEGNLVSFKDVWIEE